MSALRTTCIERTRNDIQDCLVVGAGINGSAAAAALAGKGAKISIIDKADFAAATSQESSNLAWGGIKYLETAEFGLIGALCKSRNKLMQAYPSQVQEIRFLTSIAKGFRQPHGLVYLGALLYWLMGRCHTRAPRLLSRAAIQRKAPMVNTAALAGGLEYSDAYFVDNDTRFAFGFIRQALDRGCNAINYMELTAAEWQGGLWHCTLQDQVAGESMAIKARSLINAAGPYADRLNALLGIKSRFKHIFSKGTHIIVPQITPTRHILTFFASDSRPFFMIPMGDRTCIGTTDTRADHAAVEATSDEVDFLLANANALLDLAKPLTPADVIATRCGVRPLVVKQDAEVGNAEWTALSRKHEIDQHPEQKMLSIYGGKLTDCINIGEEVAAMIKASGIPLFPSLKPWYGEPRPHKKAQFEAAGQRLRMEADEVSRLWRRYGTGAFRILEKIKDEPDLAARVIAHFSRAELHYIAENEMVVHLEDFLHRRSRLELTVHRATLRCDPGLPEVARILFGKQATTELNRYLA